MRWCMLANQNHQLNWCVHESGQKSCHVGERIIAISEERAHRQRFRRMCGNKLGL